MNPFFFGSSKQPLYGVYHPPKARTTRTTGVVLAYPLWQEYMRAHRAFRQLAMLLSKAGFPVLRFDYFATGDSSGDSVDGSLSHWGADIDTAIDELKDMAGVAKVSLVGLRLGGSLVASAASRRSDLDRVVLWDPIVDGAAHLAALLAQSEIQNRKRPPGVAEVVGLHGFPLTPRMREELSRLDLTAVTPANTARTFVVVSEEREEYGRYRDRLTPADPRATYRCIPSAGNWGEIDQFGSALMPQQIIQGIVTCLTEERVS